MNSERLSHVFSHRFRDGCRARLLVTFDPESLNYTSQAIGPDELIHDNNFYRDEWNLWTTAIEGFFLDRVFPTP